MPETVAEKIKNLERRLINLTPFALAFSGGVDSTLLLAVAKRAACDPFLVITLNSQLTPENEIKSAQKTARFLNVELMQQDIDIFQHKNITANTSQRCYFCKKQMFGQIKKMAAQHGIVTLIHGENLDDQTDFRPGSQAAKELGFTAPLVDEGFTKKEIRNAARSMGLANWNKPSQSCYATRIQTNEIITPEKLHRIAAMEGYLKELGYTHIRVRVREDSASIEVHPEQAAMLMSSPARQQQILQHFSASGFKHTEIKADGYSNPL